MAPSTDGFGCTECSDAQRRIDLGCDSPSTTPVRHLEPCPFCEGLDSECDECHGTNRVPLYRCPRAHFGARELDAVTAAALVEQGVLPCAGGWLDQSYTWVRAFPLIAQEIASWRKVLHDRAQREAEAKAKRNRR